MTALENSQGGFEFSSHQLRCIFDSLSAHIVIIDETGQILETNAAWRQFASQNGMPPDFDFRQLNYLKVCRAADGDGINDARAVEKGIQSVISGVSDLFLYDYPCHSPEGKRWFYMRAVPVSDVLPLRVIVSHEDITQLKLVQEALKEKQAALEDRNMSLEEANIALKVLIRQREEDREELENRFLGNVKTLVLPYIRKLKDSSMNEKDKTLVGILEAHLNDIMSPLVKHFSNAGIMLTPQELQVAALVRDGKSSSEIADILYVSLPTVSFHRRNLRKKLGLNNKKVNLRSHLLSMS